MTTFRRFVRDRRTATWWWLAGMVALAGFTVAFWPTIRGQASFDDLVRQLPEGMRSVLGIDASVSISSAPGYLQGRVFGTILPLVLIVHAAGLGASVIAGPESDRTLELVLANPIGRRRLYLERCTAALVVSTVPAAAAAVSLVVLGQPVGLMDGVAVGTVLAATAAAWALATLFGSIAAAVGAVSGRRSLSLAVAAGSAVASYLLQGLLSAAGGSALLLELTPWHWYVDGSTLVHGVGWSAIVLPLAVTLVVCGIGGWGFDRRDLR